MVLREPLKQLSDLLSGDFGGAMEHLWIDFELNEAHAERRPPFPFRFQKRVSGRSSLVGLPIPDSFNVGHYSVRPDFHRVRTLPPDALVGYAFALLFRSTEALVGKQKKLAGFDALAFREHFRAVWLKLAPGQLCDAL